MGEIVEAIKKQESIKPPKAIFVPEKHLIRHMIRAVVKYGSEENES